MLIGITGSLGSGKSTVGRLLRERGAALIDADALTRDLQAPGRLLTRRLAAAFGAGIIAADGALDRGALAKRAFGDPESLKRLNAIVHPAVRRQEAALIARCAGHPLVALEIPLLFENRLHRLMDWVVVVHADDDVRMDRLKAGRGMDEAEARQRMAAQMPAEAKRELAHFIIENSGGMADTEAQVDRLWRRLARINRTICTRRESFHNPFIPFRRGETA